MSPVLQVGCPMWAHRPWVGPFLPEGTRSGDELIAYSRFVNAVEGNTTFYASPSPATVEKWAAQAAPGFRFALKVPRAITHERRLRVFGAPLREFLDLVAPLGELVGTLTLQLPPSFGPDDLGALAGTLRSLPVGYPWAVEVRHPALFEGMPARSLARILASLDVEQVVFDTTTLFAQPPSTDAEHEAWRKKPRVPLLQQALTERPVVRYLGRDDADATIAGWQRWLPVLAQWLDEGRTPSFFVHTPNNALVPGLARRLHADVTALVPSLAALPSPLVEAPASTPRAAPAAIDPNQPALF